MGQLSCFWQDDFTTLPKSLIKQRIRLALGSSFGVSFGVRLSFLDNRANKKIANLNGLGSNRRETGRSENRL